MTLSTAIAALGVQIYVERNGSPGTFDKIPNQRNADLSGVKVKFADITHLDGGGWDEKLATTLDPGQITAEIDYNETNSIHQQIMTDLIAKTQRNFRYVFPSGSHYIAAAGGYESFNPTAKPDAAFQRKLVIQLTGPATVV